MRGKYALNGLFLIDDTKDADATNDQGGSKQDLTPNHPKWDGAKQSIASKKVKH